MQTELVLHHWRLGQTIAERLCAGILRLSGYAGIDPQAPLGGGDGKKDLIAWRKDRKCVAAAYFPTTPSSFTAIRNKYKGDLAGVALNDADGFVFLVNQHLTVGQRRELLALGNPQTDEIFHLERMRAVLDDPRGYGLRLEFLRIAMNHEEQVAFFNTVQRDRIQKAVEGEILAADQPSRLPMTARLDISLLAMLHHALYQNIAWVNGEVVRPVALGGQIRTTEAFIVGSDGDLRYRAIPAEDIQDALNTHLKQWRILYADAVAADHERALHALAWFHYGLVAIMPFADGNGRLAWLVTNRAAYELCRRGVAADLTTDRPAYFAALNAADRGDLNPLIELLRAALV